MGIAKPLHVALSELLEACEKFGFTPAVPPAELLCLVLRAAKVWPGANQLAAIHDLLSRAIKMMSRGEESKNGVRFLRDRIEQGGQLHPLDGTPEEFDRNLVAAMFAALHPDYQPTETDSAANNAEIVRLRAELDTELTEIGRLTTALAETERNLATAIAARDAATNEIARLTVLVGVVGEPTVRTAVPNGHGNGHGNGELQAWQRAALWFKRGNGSGLRAQDIAKMFDITGSTPEAIGVTVSCARTAAGWLTESEIISATSAGAAAKQARLRGKEVRN